MPQLRELMQVNGPMVPLRSPQTCTRAALSPGKFSRCGNCSFRKPALSAFSAHTVARVGVRQARKHVAVSSEVVFTDASVGAETKPQRTVQPPLRTIIANCVRCVGPRRVAQQPKKPHRRSDAFSGVSHPGRRHLQNVQLRAVISHELLVEAVSALIRPAFRRQSRHLPHKLR